MPVLTYEELCRRLKRWLRREAANYGVTNEDVESGISTTFRKGKNDSVALVITIKNKKLLRPPFYNTLGVWGTFEDFLVLCEEQL